MELDVTILREQLGPGGPWAVQAGDNVRRLRTDLQLTEEQLAKSAQVSVTTIKRIEAGQIVPRDYLRAALAAILRRDVADIWPPMRCDRARSLAVLDVGEVA